MAQLITRHVPSPATSTAVVRTVKELELLRDEWNALFEAAQNPSPPLHFDWVSIWLQQYGEGYLDGESGLRVICCRQNGNLVGILPLYQRHPMQLSDGGRHLRFVSTGESERDEICPDYMDLLSTESHKEQCANLAWGHIFRELDRTYDRLELAEMADDSAMVNWARANGAAYDLQIIPRGVCAIADLTGGFDAYLARLSSNTRQQARRLLRSSRQAGVELECARTLDEAYAFFEEMVQLHQRRWEAAGQPGCFSSRSFTAFHRQLIRAWLPSGRALLTRLRVGGQTLAVKYGFRIGDKFDFYQSGVRMDDDCPVRSPGIVSFMMLMQHLIGQGVVTFDFLRGSSSYKQRLTTTAQPLVTVRRVRWTLGTTMGFVAELGARGIRRAGRLATGRSHEPRSHESRGQEQG